MKSLVLICFSSLIFVSCGSLSEKGSKVELIVVQGSAREIKAKQAELEKDGCVFLKKVEAPIVWGSAPVDARLAAGLKNKVAEEGGNAVISSLAAHGVPMKSNGLAYKCNDKGIDTDI